MESAMIENLMTLGMLVLLQAVLGFDNLLYISLESKRVPPEKQAFVRKMGIGVAIVLRIALLFLLVSVIKYFQDPIFHLALGGMKEAEEGATAVAGIIDGTFNIHALIVLAGGVLIIYTATKEIFHMMGVDDLHHAEGGSQRSVKVTIMWIVIMNLVFSFDSILSAMALTEVFWVMATAIIIGGVLMIWLSDAVASFLEKNRLYEVLGLFILLIVGIMLLTEGGHLAHLHLFGNEIVQMSKTTFYFIITVLVAIDIVQGRYQKRLMAERALKAKHECADAKE
jgi:predicted tellurium resistance membrane protein TerC